MTGRPTRAEVRSTPTSSPPHRPLYGRETEVRRLGESVAAAAAGQGGVVVVDGTAGLGKSRLVLEAAIQARRLGVAVAPGAAGKFRRTTPLAPLLEAMRNSSPPILSETEFAPAQVLEYGATRLIDQLETALRGTVARHPVLITLDDLQWSDLLTVVAVRALTERLATSPVLWLLSRRPWPSMPTLDTLVSDLAAAGAVRLQLAPLPPAAVTGVAGDLLGATPDTMLLELLDKCAGNPSMIVDLLSTLADDHELVIDAAFARLRPAPEQRLRGWLTQVGPLTRQLLSVASIFGRTFDLPPVARVLHCQVAELLPSIDEALGVGLLVEEGARLSFQHALVREAAYDALPADARKSLHREAADALLGTGGSISEAAAHAIIGAERGDTHFVALLVRASDEVAADDPGAAADLRLRAVDLMPTADADRPQRLLEATGLLFRAGRRTDALTLAEDALRADLPVDIEARLRCQLADSLGIAGYSASALHHATTALGLRGVDDSTRALLYAAASKAHLVAGDAAAALRAGEQAITVGTRPVRAGRALLVMAAAERVRGRLTRALELVDRAVDLLAGDPAGVQHPETSWARGRTLMALDRFEEAQAAFDAGSRWVGAAGTEYLDVPGYISRAMLQLQRGRLDEAVAEGNSGLIQAEELGLSVHVPVLCAVLAQAHAYRGEFEPGRRRLRRGVSAVSEPRSVGAQQLAWATAALDEAAGEDPSRVLAELSSASDQLPNGLQALAFDPMAGPFLVRLARRVGDAALAGMAAEATDALGRINRGVTSFVAAAMQAGGLLDDDADRLVAAARAFEASPRPLARARAAEDAAQALLQRGRRAQAVEQFESALAGYTDAGAVVLAQRARERLADVTGPRGGTPATGNPSFGWASLTAAELRVARLAAVGLTNRAIADELGLSPHTVESHLRHSFRKLDVRSRVELTRVVLTADR
ncbi:AAA family ATPase [Kribbella sp. NPDC048915]|uniref:ATP-binding protein n=1 Tax=Kribbella sp. NPDC048915 TaxID=3155148 RepID=UPI0033E88EF8